MENKLHLKPFFPKGSKAVSADIPAELQLPSHSVPACRKYPNLFPLYHTVPFKWLYTS